MTAPPDDAAFVEAMAKKPEVDIGFLPIRVKDRDRLVALARGAINYKRFIAANSELLPDAKIDRQRVAIARLETQTSNLRQRLADAEARGQVYEAFWRAFWDALNEQEFCYVEMDCEALVTEKAMTLGLVKSEPYDPAVHGEICGDPEPGDLIYTLAALTRRTT